MSKLVLLTLGGTGERVVKSFVMQLASGLQLKDSANNMLDVQIVFLDTDVQSKALTEATDYITEYRQLYDYHHRVRQRFNGQIDLPLFSTNILAPLRITIDGAALGSLHTIFDINNLDEDEKAEMDMLYNDRAQQMDLRKGFIGMPNIGTIALNHLLGNIAHGIGNDDKIFFVNSLFGGTGAAGFPLILNKLQQTLNLSNANNQISLGYLTVLPYFKFVADGTIEKHHGFTVDAGEFDGKSYAALLYYANHLHTDGISAQYFIGSNQRSEYPHHLGGGAQDNPAHIIEYMAATSIFHFAKNVNPRNAGNNQLKYFEYWFGEGNGNDHNLNDIPESDNKRSFVRLQLFEYIMKKELESYVKNNHGVFADQYNYCNRGTNLTSLQTLINKYNNFFGFFDTWKNQLNATVHSASLKFAFFNDYPGTNEVITEKFNPKINTTHREGYPGFRHDVVTDPDFLGKMSSAVGDLASTGWNEDEKNLFTVYLVQQSVEMALNDVSQRKSINI